MKNEVAKAANEQNAPTVVVTNEQKATWWSNLTPEQRKLITNFAIWSGISLVAAVTLFFGVRFIKKKIANHAKGKSFGENKWATWADQLHNAIKNDGWFFGTDEQSIRKVLQAIPSRKHYEKVERYYKKQFNKVLADDLRGDLSTSEYDEMLAIIESKPLKARDAGIAIYDPIGWAKRLNAAFNYRTWGFLWGTDMDAIRTVLTEIPTQQAFLDTAEAYQDQYGIQLMKDVKGDLDLLEIAEFAQLIKRKPLK